MNYPLKGTLLFNRQRDRLLDQGISTFESNNIDDFTDAYAELSGNKSVSAPMDTQQVDIDPSDFLWFRHTNNDEDTVAVQAFLREKITTSLGRHLDRQYCRLYCNNNADAIAGHAPGADKITGEIVYHGNLWITKKYRGNRLAGMLCRHAMVAVVKRWDPDFIWGYVAEALVANGYATRIGYWHSQPYGTHYNLEPDGISEKDWLVWMSREDLHYWLELGQQGKGPV